MKDQTERPWSQVITPRRGWLDLRLIDTWRYRDLVWMFVTRNIVTVYSQTVLGPVWYFLQPLINTIVFTIIFGRMAKLSTDGAPDFLFYLSGTIAWNYFQTCFKDASTTFVTNAGIFGKVYFPRLVVPVAASISALAQFLIQLVLLFGCIIYYRLAGASIGQVQLLVLLPLIALQLALIGLGSGLLVSALTTKYRDIGFLMTFGLQLWMYASPVIYPASTIPERFRLIYMANPMASVIESFRVVTLGIGSLNLTYMVVGWLGTIALMFVGLLLFSRVEQTSVDTV
ncbi:MAG: ABC transporter permease [Leptospirales bacterium]|nr:ABC transporter permease [Leptospirales bacterium]